MNERLKDATKAPTAMVGALLNGRAKSSGWPPVTLTDVSDWFESAPGVVGRVLPGRRNGKLASLVPGRKKRKRRRMTTLKLAQNVGTAVSAATFAVDLASEIRRVADMRRVEAGEGTTGQSRDGAPEEAGDQALPAKGAAPAKKAAPGKKAPPGKKTAPAKKTAPGKKAAPAKKAEPARKAAPAKRAAPARKTAPAKKAAPRK